MIVIRSLILGMTIIRLIVGMSLRMGMTLIGLIMISRNK